MKSYQSSKNWDLKKFVKKDHTNSFAIQTADLQQFHFIKGRDISPVLLKQIIKDIRLTVEEFLNYK